MAFHPLGGFGDANTGHGGGEVMSIPIKYCDLVKAVDHPETLDELKSNVQFNINYGSMSIIDCHCDPPCRELSAVEYDLLNEQLGLSDEDEDEEE